MPFYDENRNPVSDDENTSGTFYDENKAPIKERPIVNRSLFDRIPDIGITALKGAIGLPESFVGLSDIPTGGAVGKGFEKVGIRFKEAQDILESMYSPAQQEANRQVAEAEGILPTIKAAVTNPSTIANAVIESIPSMMGGFGISRGLMKAGTIADAVIAGAIGEGAISAGQTAEQIRQNQESGLLNPEQAVLSALSGGATSVLGIMGGKLAQRLNIIDPETFVAAGKIAGTVDNMKNLADKGILRRIVESAIEEGALEELPQSAQEQAAQNVAIGRPPMEGVANAAVMGMLTGAVMGGAGGAGGVALERMKPIDPLAGAVKDLQTTLARDLGVEEYFAEPAFEERPAPQKPMEFQQALPPGPETPAIEPYDYFQSLEGEPLTAQETTDKAIERLSQRTDLSEHETQQLKDLARIKEIPESTGPLSLLNETRYLLNKVLSVTDKPQEISNMIQWYSKAYPKQTGMLALRNKLLDITHGGRYNEGQNGESYRAELQTVANARKGIYPIGSGETTAPLGMIPKKASRTFTGEFKANMGNFINSRVATWIQDKTTKNLPFAVTEPQIDKYAQTAGVTKDEILEFLGGERYNGKTGIPVIPYKKAYEIEFEKQVPKPIQGREKRPIFSWILKNHDGKKGPKISVASLERAFGSKWREDKKSLGLDKISTEKGGADFFQIITEKKAGNPLALDENDQDAGSKAAELIRGEYQAAKEGKTHADNLSQWEQQRDNYVTEQAKGKETALTEETAHDTFVEEMDLSDQLLKRAEALSPEISRQVASLVNDPDFDYEFIDNILKGLEEGKLGGKAAQEGELSLWKDAEEKIKENARLHKEKVLEKRELKDQWRQVQERQRKEGIDQFHSIEDLEKFLFEQGHSIRTPQGIKVGYYHGEPVYERVQRVYAPDPLILVEIAKRYKTAEEFEADWSEPVLELAQKGEPWNPNYGHGREPIPLTRQNNIIRNILSKWDTSIDDVINAGDAAITIIKDHRDINILQEALDAQRMLLKAYWAAPANIDYKSFWNDVKAGMGYNPKELKLENNLTKHFLKGNDKEQQTIFEKLAADNPNVKLINVTSGTGWVQTTDQFIKNIRQNREIKPNNYYPNPIDLGVSKETSEEDRVKVAKESVLPYQGKLFQYEGLLYRGESTASGIGGIRGTHYTTSEKYARSYAEDYSDVPGRIIKEQIKLNNPLTDEATFDSILNEIQSKIDTKGKSVNDIIKETNERLRVEIEKRGYDGVVRRGVGPYGEDEIVVFHRPTQTSILNEPKSLTDLAKQIIGGKRIGDVLETDPFKGEQVVVTDSLPLDMAGLVSSWLKLLKMDTKVFVAASRDLQNITLAKMRYGLFGKGRSDIFDANSRMLKSKTIMGTTGNPYNTFGEKERYIILSNKMVQDWQTNQPRALENLAHEFGHIVQFEMWNNISEDQQIDISVEYAEWKAKIDSGTVQDYLNTVPTPYWTSGQETAIQKMRSVPFKSLQNSEYFSSFEEWFANQVSRWIVTDAKPQTATEKFFAKIAAMFKKLWAEVDKSLFRPARTVADWLDSLASYKKSQAIDRGVLDLSLFSAAEEDWANKFIEAQNDHIKATLGKDTNSLIDAYHEEAKRGGVPQLFPDFDAKDWQRDHAGQSIEFADQRMMEGTQEAENELNEDMVYKARANKPFWRNYRGLMDKYGIMKKKDIGLIESTFANPFFLGYRYQDIQSAVKVQQNRDGMRNQLIHDFMQSSNTFFRTEGETLRNVEKALIEGDRELRQRYIDLLAEGEEGKRQAADLKALNGYSDTELISRFHLNPEGIAAYRQVRTTLDTLHQRWLKQIEDRSFATYKKQKWYGLLKQLYGQELSNDELRDAKKKLGAVFTSWNKSLKSAKVPLENLLQTPETLARLNIRMENIVTTAINNIMSKEDMTEARAMKIIRRAVARLEKMEAKNAPVLNETQISEMVKEYRKQYNKVSKEITDLRGILREHLGAGQSITDNEINRELRALIQAYGRTKPQMQELKRIRNELANWIAYMPRERDDSKLHYIGVFQAIRDEEGNKIGEKTLYLNYYNIGGIGGKEIRTEIQKAAETEGWKDFEVRAERNVKEPDSTFFKVSDMNTQRVIDNALNAVKTKGKIDEVAGDEIRRIMLEAISDEMNQRGFGKHRLHRQVAFDDEGKIRTVLGYKETGLKDVLKNYITGYAGMETKQLAAIAYTDLLGQMGTEQKGVRDYVYTYANENLRNQEHIDKVSGTMRAMAFAWYLGGNLKSVFVQLTQNYVTGIPILAQSIRKIRKGMGEKVGFAEAERRYHKAMKDVGLKNLSADEARFLEEAIEKGVTMDQYIQEITGKISSSFGGKYRRVVGTLSYFFSQAETFNRKSAALAMYRFLKETGHDTKGESDTEGHIDSTVGRMVEEFVNRTHYLMGKANLPKAMMGGDVTAQTLRAAYTFRSFTHNYILSMLPQYGGDARTALHSLAYLALLGGMLSVPFMKDLFDWWEKKTGENMLGTVRKELRKYGGPTLERFGIYGLAGLALGDISGSLAMGIPFVGEPTDTMYGVWGGMARKAGQSAEALSRGDWYRGVENISPEGIANIMRGLRMSEFGKDLIGTPGYATTTKGRPIFDENGKPLSMDTMDAFRKIIGFQPAEYSEKMKTQRAVKDKETYFENMRHDIIEEYRIARLNKNQRQMAAAMKRIQEFNKERLSKDAVLIVSPLKISNVIRASQQMITKKERKEALYKSREAGI